LQAGRVGALASQRLAFAEGVGRYFCHQRTFYGNTKVFYDGSRREGGEASRQAVAIGVLRLIAFSLPR
jgi:hypothetical protein